MKLLVVVLLKDCTFRCLVWVFIFLVIVEFEARRQLLTHLLSKQHCALTDEDLKELSNRTKGNVHSRLLISRLLWRWHTCIVCRSSNVSTARRHWHPQSAGRRRYEFAVILWSLVRPVTMSDFVRALFQVRASVSNKDLLHFLDWNRDFGSFPAPAPE